MRRVTELTAIGLMAILGTATHAAARTSNTICKAACAPRIAEQCAGLSGTELRRCPRPIIKACKKTTPEIGCPTTADVTATLAGRVLNISTSNPTDITLCASRRFLLVEHPANAAPDDVGGVRSGVWAVRIVGAGLGLVLADDLASAPLRLDHDQTGTLLVDGATATLANAGAATCGSAAVNPDVAERIVLVNATRAVTDRTLVIGNGPDADQLTLCRSGLFVQGTESSPDTIEGTWTIDVSSGEPRLRLARPNALTPIFGLGFRSDGAILVDDVVVGQRDARDFCLARDFEQRLTAALNNTAYFFIVNVGNIPVRTKIGLCDSGRYRLDQTSTEHGNWRVTLSSNGFEIEMVKDGTQTVRRFPVGFDANGGVRLNGTSPIDEPGLVDSACAG